MPVTNAGVAPRDRWGPLLRRARWSLPFLLAAALVVAGIAYLLHASSLSARENAATDARNLSQILETKLRADFAVVEHALSGMLSDIDPEAMRPATARRNDPAIWRLLASRVRGIPSVSALRYFDASGDLLYSSVADETAINIADRPHFRQLRDDPAIPIVYSDVLVGRATRRAAMVVAKPVRDRDGAFVGIAVAVVDLTALQEQFRAIDIGNGGAVALRRMDDGALVLRYPEAVGGDSSRASDFPVRRAILAGTSDGSIEAVSPVDQVRRIYGYRVIAGFPFYVVVGVSEAGHLSGGRSAAIVGALAAGLLLLLLAVAEWRRNRGEVAVRASEQRFRDLIALNAAAILQIDAASGRIVDANPAACRFYGWSHRELCAKAWRELDAADGERGATAAAAAAAAAATDGDCSVATHRLASGETRSVELHSTPVVVGDRLVRVSIIYDVTQRTRAEAQVELLLHEQRAILDSRVVGIAKLRERRFVWMNAAFAQMLGYTDLDLIGQPTNVFYPSDEAHAAFGVAASQVMQRGEIFRTEVEYRRKDRSLGWYDASGAMLSPGSSETVWAFVDITARKRFEAESVLSQAAMREGEQRLRAMFSAMSEGLIFQAASGVIVEANRAAEAILGLDREQLLGRVSTDPRWRVVREDGSTFPGELHPATVTLRTGQPVRGQVMGLDVPGRGLRWISVNSAPVGGTGDGAPEAAVTTFGDITERRAAEELARRQSERLRLLHEASQRLNRTLDLKEIYRVVGDLMHSVAPNDSLVISAFDPETKLITCRAYLMGDKWLDVTPFPAIPLEDEGHGTQSVVIRTGHPLLVNDYQARMRTTRAAYYVDDQTNAVVDEAPQDLDEDVTRSALIVPLKIGGAVNGVVQVLSYRPDAYTEDQLNLLDALALHIATAEQNALLYARVQAELRERAAAEDQLRKLSLAVEQSTASIVITNTRADIEYVNNAFLAATGYARHEVIGSNPRFLNSGRTPRESYASLWAALTAGEAWRGEFRNRRKDGSDYDELAIITPLRQADGTISHYVAVKEDISEGKRLARELEQHRHHLEELVAGRTAALEAANYRLLVNDQRLSAMHGLSQKAQSLDERAILQLGVETAVQLTGSEMGYVHLVDPDQENLTLGIWSQGALERCTAAHASRHPASAAGVWADTIRLRRAVIANDYPAASGSAGCPEGHPRLLRHLGVPVIEGGLVRLLIGVGNKATDYDDSDARQLQLFGNDLWSIVMRRRAELELAAAEARTRLIVDSSADGIMQLDNAGRIALVNPAACAMLGYAPADLIGRDLHDAVHHVPGEGAAATHATCRLRVAMIAGRVLREDAETFWRADGRPLSVTVAVHPMRRGEAVIGAVMTFADNTRRQAADDAREAARAAAERLARTRSEFLANMSHEIRTPLNGVLGMAQIGYRDSAGRGKARDTFWRILESGRLLSAIVDDVLDLSKIEAGKLAIESIPIDPRRSVDAAVAALADRAALKGMQIVAEKAPNLPASILGDPIRIAQILINLLSNSVKFTEHGEIRLAAFRDGGQLVFRVSDTGIGIAAEHLERLFSPFEQVDGSTTRRYGGTGLGLTISRQLAGLMSGEIHASSRLGSGSDFELRLPCVESAEGAAPAPAPSFSAARPLSRLKGLRILVAEDNEANQLMLDDVLSFEGAQLEIVANGRLAVDAVARDPQAFDVVLMDVQMPEMDGREATRRIAAIAPALPVIGQTAHALPEEHERCRAAGMVETITKPLDYDALVAMILRHVGQAPAAVVPAPPADTGTAPSADAGPPVRAAMIDWARLERRHAGRPDFLKRLLGITQDSQSATAERIRAAAAAGDMDQLAFLAHGLKGTGGNLFAGELQAQAAAIETAIRAASPGAAADAGRLAATLDAMLAEVREYLA